jgi:hypothetical protein
MIIESKIFAALGCDEPEWALRSVVDGFLAQGHEKQEVYDALERIVLRARQTGEFGEATEDLIFNVLDALTGWCHSDGQLPSKPPPAPLSTPIPEITPRPVP